MVVVVVNNIAIVKEGITETIIVRFLNTWPFLICHFASPSGDHLRHVIKQNVTLAWNLLTTACREGCVACTKTRKILRTKLERRIT